MAANTRSFRPLVAGVLAAVAAAGPPACGGSTATDSRTTESLYTDLCQHERSSECGTAALEASCLSRSQRDRADAARESCVAELDGYLRCATSHPIQACTCIEQGCTPAIDESCSPLLRAFTRCVTWLPDTCSLSFAPPPSGADGGAAPISCGVQCPALASTCEGTTGAPSLDCTCISGPHAGRAFQTTDCSGGIIASTGHLCGAGKPSAADGPGGVTSAAPREPAPGDPCTTNVDCGAALECTLGHCHLSCKTSQDCSAAERCIAAPGGDVCQLAAEASCSYNTDCATPLVCAPDRRCRNQCVAERDCITGQVCIGGVCAEPQDVAGLFGDGGAGR